MTHPAPALVIGSINIDIVGRVPHLPVPGQTLHGTGLRMALGGKGANQAVALARLGVPVRLLARVGEDDFAATARARLRALGVDDASVLGTPGHATGIALIHVDAQGQNAISVFPGANAVVGPADVERHAALVDGAGMLLLQLETPWQVSAAAARRVRTRGGLAMLDPAPCPTHGVSDELLQAVDVVTPNEIEATMLTGQPCDTPDGARRAAQVLLDRGVRHVVVKLGHRGALLRSCAAAGGLDLLLPAFQVSAVDTVAAGDCFNAGLACALLAGQDWAGAMRYASAAAASSTTRPGAAESAPTAGEVQDFLARA